ncbi:MAG TPA: hypothetical protein VFT66_15735 [Roseiflexaceae bacterium]|nr:hypothetical protein [Roseiflexaceae bacterium]
MYEPSSNKPLLKILGGGFASLVAGALTTIIIYLLTQNGTTLPQDVQSAISTLIGALVSIVVYFVTAYLIPLRAGEVQPIKLEPHPIETAPEEGQ